MAHFHALWRDTRSAFSQQRTWERAQVLAASAVACLGRHTVTGLLTTSAQEQRDWTAAYRLFERDRVEAEAFWQPARRSAVALVPPEQPVVAVLDDTLTRKCGRKVAGTAWRRDPLGPKFRVNLVWGQRFLQVAVAVPADDGSVRAIPVDLQHCPTPRKPGKQASADALRQYKIEQAQCRLPAVAARRIQALREALDADPGGETRPLLVAVDGGYTNRTTFRQVPERTALVGRVRKDAVLYAPPAVTAGRGRRRCYGDRVPTPEALRQDANLPWQQVSAYAAGKWHTVDIKVIDPVRWRGCGATNMRLVILRPLAYRPTPHHRLLYREPAYLLCSDPTYSSQQIVTAYLWRWEMEVAFREEKTLFGLGEAQVRTAAAVANVPTFLAGVYAYLHLAALQGGTGIPALPRPKWQHASAVTRTTTGQLQGRARAELWAHALGVNLTDFLQHPSSNTKSEKMPPNPFAAVVYAQK